MITNYLNNPRNNRNSGVKVKTTKNKPSLEVESLGTKEVCYFGRGYSVETFRFIQDGILVKYESIWKEIV